MQEVIPCVSKVIQCLLETGLTEAMNKFNGTDFRRSEQTRGICLSGGDETRLAQAALVDRRCGLLYAPVLMMILLAPFADRFLGIKMTIPPAVRLPLGIILLVVSVPIVIWTITRFLRTKGSRSHLTRRRYGRQWTLPYCQESDASRWTVVLLGLAVLMQSFTLLVIFIRSFYWYILCI